MTNREAIRILALERDDWETSHCTPMKRKEAFEMAINALVKEAWKEEHTVSPLLDLQPCKQDDLISRAAAIDALEKSRFPGAPYIDRGILIALKEIKKLPPAQPKHDISKANFLCPICGAEMEVAVSEWEG